MLTFQSVFERELGKEITRRIAEIKDHMGAGMSVPTIEAYRMMVGEIRGLQWALEAFEVANEAAAGRVAWRLPLCLGCVQAQRCTDCDRAAQ